MKRKIRFSLVYRDMWQSSGKYQPRVDQLKEVAPHIIEMGCFDQIETNGGAFEQVQLMYGENPNNAVREWTRPFNEAGIETHILECALNRIRMYPVPADIHRPTEPSKPGGPVNAGERICYIQTSSYIDEIVSPFDGEVAEIVVLQGTNVNKGDILFKIKELKKKKSGKKSENK
jgi:hypothetical protein